jgi:hypothetical protein
MGVDLEWPMTRRANLLAFSGNIPALGVHVCSLVRTFHSLRSRAWLRRVKKVHSFRELFPVLPWLLAPDFCTCASTSLSYLSVYPGLYRLATNFLREGSSYVTQRGNYKGV